MLTDRRIGKRKDNKFVRVTAYLPEQTYDKMVSYMCHNAVADGGRPQMVGYGAISSTVTDAIEQHCVIGYDYSLLKPEDGDTLISTFTPTKIGLYDANGKLVEEKKDEV